MKNNFKKSLISLSMIYTLLLLSACKDSTQLEDVKKFSNLSPSEQEDAFKYNFFYKPKKVGNLPAYIGDTMTYYENGTYYIYYLKEGGNSTHHPIYLVTTKDFINYKEYDKPIIEADINELDEWIGTGSLVKCKNEYYFFYTSHAGSQSAKPTEKIMVAKGSSLTSFKKISTFEITPPKDIEQDRDFRDPQAYYDKKTDKITLTITASKDNVARILKYSLDSNLENVNYDGIIFTDPSKKYLNLECSDTFCIGNKWYITYSAQDDVLWYATSDKPYGPYSSPKALEGKLFYAAKHVQDENSYYMIGWARKAETPISPTIQSWAGNLVVQEIKQKENGDLYLSIPQKIKEHYSKLNTLSLENSSFNLSNDSSKDSDTKLTVCENYMLTGKFRYTNDEKFGFAFEYDKNEKHNKLITLDPKKQEIELSLSNGKNPITSVPVQLKPNTDYTFTLLQDGSVCLLEIDGYATLTTRLYGVTGKTLFPYNTSNNISFNDLKYYK